MIASHIGFAPSNADKHNPSATRARKAIVNAVLVAQYFSYHPRRDSQCHMMLNSKGVITKISSNAPGDKNPLGTHCHL